MYPKIRKCFSLSFLLLLCSSAFMPYGANAILPEGADVPVINALATEPCYDFAIDGIYYSIVSGTTQVEVTYATEAYDSYSGDVVIPVSVSHLNTTYTVTGLTHYAFAYSANLKSVTLPQGITSIGASAFYECDGLKKLDFPESLTSFADWACFNSTGLEQIAIEATALTGVGSDVFAYCTSLRTFYCNLSTPGSLFSSDVFLDDPLSSATLYVPIGCAQAYTAAGGVWSDFGTLSEFYNLKINKQATDGQGHYYATLFQNVPLDIPSGVTATYPASASSDALNYVSYSATIPAGAASLVTATAPGRYFFIKNSANTAVAPAGNLLCGASTSTTVSSASHYYYTLSRAVNSYGDPVAGTIGFYWYANDGHSVTCPAGRAYIVLPVSGGEAVRAYRLGEGGAASILSPFAAMSQKRDLYTLDGRVAREPLHRGVYIKDGKRVWIR